MPLVWAHSEFIKLCYSRALGYPVDRPVATWKRYQGKRPVIFHDIWGPSYRPRQIRQGNQFTIALRAHALVHWGINGWNDARGQRHQGYGTRRLDDRDFRSPDSRPVTPCSSLSIGMTPKPGKAGITKWRSADKEAYVNGTKIPDAFDVIVHDRS